MSLEWELAIKAHCKGSNFDCLKEIELLFAEEKAYQNSMIEKLNKIKEGREVINQYLGQYSKEYDELRKKTREVMDEIARLSPTRNSDGQCVFGA